MIGVCVIGVIGACAIEVVGVAGPGAICLYAIEFRGIGIGIGIGIQYPSSLPNQPRVT